MVLGMQEAKINVWMQGMAPCRRGVDFVQAPMWPCSHAPVPPFEADFTVLLGVVRWHAELQPQNRERAFSARASQGLEWGQPVATPAALTQSRGCETLG
jgi:hypothetical protein